MAYRQGRAWQAVGQGLRGIGQAITQSDLLEEETARRKMLDDRAAAAELRAIEDRDLRMEDRDLRIARQGRADYAADAARARKLGGGEGLIPDFVPEQVVPRSNPVQMTATQMPEPGVVQGPSLEGVTDSMPLATSGLPLMGGPILDIPELGATTVRPATPDPRMEMMAGVSGKPFYAMSQDALRQEELDRTEGTELRDRDRKIDELTAALAVRMPDESDDERREVAMLIVNGVPASFIFPRETQVPRILTYTEAKAHFLETFGIPIDPDYPEEGNKPDPLMPGDMQMRIIRALMYGNRTPDWESPWNPRAGASIDIPGGPPEPQTGALALATQAVGTTGSGAAVRFGGAVGDVFRTQPPAIGPDFALAEPTRATTDPAASSKTKISQREYDGVVSDEGEEYAKQHFVVR